MFLTNDFFLSRPTNLPRATVVVYIFDLHQAIVKVFKTNTKNFMPNVSSQFQVNQLTTLLPSPRPLHSISKGNNKIDKGKKRIILK